MLTDEERSLLIQSASEIRQWAYAPYSHYPVGAAVLAASGRVYSGVNIENAAYPSGTCAERVAVFKAVSEGERQFTAIAVVTDKGGSPCGTCRQVLAEFGLETIVIIADKNGKVVQETTVADLLPDSFGPQDLPKSA
jgi:cytidine deaminase